MTIEHRHQSSAHDHRVDEYLSRLRMREFMDSDDYLDDLYQNYDEQVIDEWIELIQARSSNTREEGLEDTTHGNDADGRPAPSLTSLFDFKNQSLRFSLDLAGYSTHLYRKFLTAILPLLTACGPRQLLDLGCENGIVTCFYALLFPKCEVIGVDISESAIVVATRLADELSLNNVRFIRADILNADSLAGLSSFDVVTSLCAFQEIAGYLSDWRDGAAAVAGAGPNCADTTGWQLCCHRSVQLSSGIRQALRDTSSLAIFCERLSGEAEFGDFASILRSAGLEVDQRLSRSIQFHELGTPEEMPMFVARPVKQG